ncbi:beta-lactamase family protein [bacterium]|nr:beta-lactamase family protein [bacterium]
MDLIFKRLGLQKKFFSILILTGGLLIFNSLNFSQTLPKTHPQDVGISPDRLSCLHSLIQDAIQNRDFPGAVVLVARKGKIVFHRAYGESQWLPEHHSMEKSMIFDLASLTKPVATATSIMMLVEKGKIRLWDKVKDFIPSFIPYQSEKEKKKKEARIWHLLTHTSGLPSYTDVGKIKEKYGSSCSLESLMKHIAHLPKTDPPGESFRYSCLGYITLHSILKKVTGINLAQFSEKHIFKPLGMNRTFFNPPSHLHAQCVPTELIEGKPLKGTVHDPLARLQGGVSGNAGLFSTAKDLAVFSQMILNKGGYKGTRILSPLTVKRMTSIYPQAFFSGRGLGWDLESPYATAGGDIFGSRSFGHTGYTGTSLWIDPETETMVIFLTNRVHPHDKGSVVSLRSKVANVVASSIMKKGNRKSF